MDVIYLKVGDHFRVGGTLHKITKLDAVKDSLFIAQVKNEHGQQDELIISTWPLVKVERI